MYSFHFPPSGFPVYIGYQKIVNEKISVCKQIMIVYRNSMKITLGQGGHIVVVQCPPKELNRYFVLLGMTLSRRKSVYKAVPVL